ncbi:MAG: phosphoadenylyl-sulfate reductase [Verrucomicrobia bacterium]|nr:phosphoadenylyl-sulfate reductase [Verrucomicrobiota bacterium]
MSVIFDFDQGVLDLESTNAKLEQSDAEERVRWAHEHFGDRLILSTSFGIQSAVMLHLVTRIVPDIPVVFIDTGYLFPETYQFAEQLQERLELNLKVYQPLMTAARQEALYGKLWEQGREGLEKYGRINKAEPMNRAVRELGAVAWLTGLRRKQSKSRADLTVVTVQNKTTKIQPILDWSEKEIYYYLKTHDLPFHPLWEKGYVSIGDWHSTRPLTDGMQEEETRFGGIKRECGLHELSGQGDWQI